VTLDPGSRASISYRLLAAEVEERFGLGRVRAVAPGGAATPPTPGPGGRGYGTVAPEPPGLDQVWPRAQPWTVSS
jgi:hypothetical protein